MITPSRRLLTPALALTLAAALAAALVAPRGALGAEGPATKGSFSATLASRYVWRGQVLTTGLALQPNVSVAVGGFSASIWANIDLDNEEVLAAAAADDPGSAGVDESAPALLDDDALALTETDVTLSYGRPFGPVTATLGYIYYGFETVDTQELFLTLAGATVLNPTLSVFYDFDQGDGGFATLSVSQGFPLGPATLTPGASIGFNLGDKAMGAGDDGDFTGFYSGEVSVAASLPLFGRVSLDPRVAYTFAIGDDGKRAVGNISKDGKESLLYGSIALTAAF